MARATRSKDAGATKLTALEKSFVFYASYHNEPVNQWIHIIFVWQILFSAFAMLAYTPAVLPGLDPMFNWNLLICSMYATYYILLDFSASACHLASALSIAGYFLAVYLKSAYPVESFHWALRVHIFSWLTQFYGHFFHEGRSPALFDNLFLSLAMAPLFVIMECMFSFGYRPDFRKKAQVLVDEQINAWAREKVEKARKKKT